jgi:hypothetical protein
MRRVAAKFVPKLLLPEQQQLRLEVAQDVLECANRNPDFLKTVITGDEPETKVQSSQWKQNENATNTCYTTSLSGSYRHIWRCCEAAKITCVHESPFYHYAQFLHPFAITYRGKKSSWILFEQSYTLGSYRKLQRPC